MTAVLETIPPVDAVAVALAVVTNVAPAGRRGVTDACA